MGQVDAMHALSLETGARNTKLGEPRLKLTVPVRGKSGNCSCTTSSIILLDRSSLLSALQRRGNDCKLRIRNCLNRVSFRLEAPRHVNTSDTVRQGLQRSGLALHLQKVPSDRGTRLGLMFR